MLRRTAAIAVLLVVRVSLARDLYVAQGAADGDGTRERPFSSVQRAADVAEPGDVVHVAAGVYRETVRPAHDGTAFVADGCAVVSGADAPKLAWKRHAGSIVVAEMPANVTQLFAGGRMMNEARWPNAEMDRLVDAPRATAGSGTTTSAIVDTGLPAVDLTGAIVHVLPGAGWVSFTRRVERSDPATHTLVLDRPVEPKVGTADVLFLRPGNPYFVFGHLALLDAPGEWFYDSAAKRLYFWPPVGVDPSRDVEIKTRDLAFDVAGRKNVRLSGFHVFAAALSLANAEHCVVEQVHVRYPVHRRTIDGYGTPNGGMPIGGRENVFRDGSVAYSSDSAFVVTGENNRVANASVHDVDWFGGDWGAISVDAPESAVHRGHVVERCTIRRAGRAGIFHRNLRRGMIRGNDIGDVCLRTKDCAATYTWKTDGDMTQIAYNDVHDVRCELGQGIYLDDSSKNHVVHHNLVHDVEGWGVLFKEKNIIVSNTIVRAAGGSIHAEMPPPWHPIKTPVDLRGAIVANNLVSLSASIGLELIEPGKPWGRTFAKALPATSRYGELLAPFAELVHPSWEPPAVLAPATFEEIRIRNGTPGKIDVWIDEVRLVGKPGTDDFVIDDFEDLDRMNAFKAEWGAFAGAGSTIALAVEKDPQTGRGAAHLTGKQEEGGWNSLQTRIRGIDPSHYAALRIVVRAMPAPLEIHAPAGDPAVYDNDDCPVDAALRPTGSACVDKGAVVAPWTNGYAGAAPDIGAVESGNPPWHAGSSIDDAAAWRACGR
jgi:hypothetical protein